MSIISFNQAKREDLLERSDRAHRKRQYREAYDLLREALRYGENAAIFNRAAAILNEMGEYEGSLQVARYALKCEPDNLLARWEMAVASERLWKLEEAIQFLNEITDRPPKAPSSREFSKKNDLLGLCQLKHLNLLEMRKTIFRGARLGELPQPMAARADRLQKHLSKLQSVHSEKSVSTGTVSQTDKPSQAALSLGLREWMDVMYGYHLLRICSPERSLSLHLLPGRSNASQFQGEHFVMGHASYADCGSLLLEFKRLVRREAAGYAGVCPCEAGSVGLALALSKILGLPLVEPTRLSAPGSVLLCLASNSGRGAPKISRHWPLRHELFILAKSFERDEFFDVVAPPHNRPLVQAWAEPLGSARRQIIGFLGEYISLPWEHASIQNPEAIKVPFEKDDLRAKNMDDRPSACSGDDRDAVRIAKELVAACEGVEGTSVSLISRVPPSP